MPRIDVNNGSCRNDKIATKSSFIKSLNGILENSYQNFSDIESSTQSGKFHSPKVFAADSITVNAPAKDVLGPKFDIFARNLKSQTMPAESTVLTKINGTANGTVNGHLMNSITNGTTNGQPKLQPLSACYDRYPKPGSYGSLQVFPMNGINSEINNAKENICDDFRQPQLQPQPPSHRHKDERKTDQDDIAKLEQDRLEEILKMCADFERQNQNVQSSPIVQNRIKTNGSLPREKKSPLSPEHIGGTANIFFPSSPGEFRQNNSNQPSSPHTPHKINTGYENVKLFAGRKTDLSSSPSSSSSRFNESTPQKPPIDSLHLTNGNSMNGYENMMSPFKSPIGYVPQSPRTRIKTCISPKKEMTSTPIQRKTDYDLLVQSFEEKLRMEVQQLRDSNNRSIDNRISQNTCQINQKSETNPSEPPQPPPKSIPQQQQHTPTKISQLPNSHQYVNVNRLTNLQEGIYGSLTNKHNHKSNNHSTVSINKNLDEKQIAQLKKQQAEMVRKARELKQQIAELQRQEEEVLTELDLEKALVSAELRTEQSQLDEMDKNMAALQTTIHRSEAQRNAKRVLQETQQNKLKQSIDMKQNQIEGLKKLIDENESETELKDELNDTIELLENDTKTFEDLEFQYLEEETDWMAKREEMHINQKTLSRQINEKRKHIQALEAQSVENQNAACADTKNIQKDIQSMIKELNNHCEGLKTIEVLLFELSGEKNTQSDSDDDLSIAILPIKRPHMNDIMSQSLFGSQEIFGTKKPTSNDLMSKSVNENLIANKIEMLSFNDESMTKANNETDYENLCDVDNNEKRDSMTSYTSNKSSNEMAIQQQNGNGNECMSQIECEKSHASMVDENSTMTNGDDDECSDPLQNLKYNLSPPFEHKASKKLNDSNGSKSANLNLSIESDDFEVNPLEKRVPSQDDIDRICKVTTNAPISTQGASFKVIESIKEIERNRQLLLTQQGSHVIEHERQKMSELKKKSHDEARAQYLQSQNHNDDSYRYKNGSLENVNNIKYEPYHRPEMNGKPPNNTVAQLRENIYHSPRHSHPEFEYERPLSEVNSEISYDALSDKQFKSSNDIRMSNRMQVDCDGSGGSQRGSMMSSENSESGRMVSGTRRNLPKHQRPLTRYLPIMSADLDLRLHIESAGHQVTLCPHVIIDSYSCRGYLHKLGATFHGWSKRWFVLDRQKMALIYYSDKSERKPRGGAYFSTIDEVYLDHLNTSKSGRPHCTFIVKTKRRSYHLQAASDAAARIWIDAIITGAQGNIDY